MTDDLPWRTLGRSGIAVPAVGIGCWAIGGPDSNLGLPMGWDSGGYVRAAAAGLEAGWAGGARLFDTADIYGHGRSERLIGRLVAGVRRDEIVLSSKVGYFAGTAEHGFEPGHMRRQLEQTLENLRTDHLDIYFLHHSDFGPGDRWLDGAAAAMAQFRAEGLVRAVGARGPHRFAVERLRVASGARTDKTARFYRTVAEVGADVLGVRDNLLTPTDRSSGIYSFAAQHSLGVLVNKPLAQSLLAGMEGAGRTFGPLDHRSRKRWFQPDSRTVIAEGLEQVRSVVGTTRTHCCRSRCGRAWTGTSTRSYWLVSRRPTRFGAIWRQRVGGRPPARSPAGDHGRGPAPARLKGRGVRGRAV